MTQQMKRRLNLILAAILCTTLLAGCNSSSAPGSSSTPDPSGSASTPDSSSAETAETEDLNGLVLPLTEEKKELDVWIIYNGTVVEDPNESQGVQKMEERTNVHVNWLGYTTSEMAEKYSIMLSSGDYPDIVFPGNNAYPGGVMAGINDGVIYDMNELIANEMPNYNLLLDSNDEAKKICTFDDGEMHICRVITGTDTTVEGEGISYGLTYRSDILEDMGLDVPTTIEEWHQVLLQCAADGMTAPMTLESDGGSSLSLAWGVNTDWASSYWQVDGENVQYAPSMDGFGEYLETMRQWYQEGLIDPNFTQGSAIITGNYSNIQDNQTMLFDIWFGFMCGTYLYDNGYITNENTVMQAVGLPVLNEGDTPIKCSNVPAAKQEIYISATCEDPVLAARWLDYQYSYEGMLLSYYGIEGVTYEFDNDGVPQYTDYVFSEENGLTASQILQSYTLNAGGGSWFCYQNLAAGDKVSVRTSSTGTTPTAESKPIWNEPTVNIALPSVTLTSDESDIIATYMTAIETLVQEHMVGYIIGSDSTPHEEFVESLYSYGLQECIDAYQAAYERYLAR